MQVPIWPAGIAVSPCFLFYFARDIKDVMLFVVGGGFLLLVLDWLLLCDCLLLLQGGRCEHTGTHTEAWSPPAHPWQEHRLSHHCPLCQRDAGR